MNDAKGNPIECPWCKAIPERTDLAPSQRYRITHESLCFLIGRLTDPWGRDGRSHFIPLQEIDAWNAAARVSAHVTPTVHIPDGQWQHVQIKAGNPRVVAIQFETPEQATEFINSFAAASPVAPVGQSEADPRCEICETTLVLTLDQRTTWQQYACPESGKGNKLGHTIIPVGYKQSPATPAPSAATQDEAQQCVADAEQQAREIVEGCSNWHDIQHKIVPRIVIALQSPPIAASVQTKQSGKHRHAG